MEFETRIYAAKKDISDLNILLASDKSGNITEFTIESNQAGDYFLRYNDCAGDYYEYIDELMCLVGESRTSIPLIITSDETNRMVVHSAGVWIECYGDVFYNRLEPRISIHESGAVDYDEIFFASVFIEMRDEIKLYFKLRA